MTEHSQTAEERRSPWGDQPDIGVALVSTLPDDIAETFVQAAAHPKLRIETLRPPPPKPYAAVEWYLPTAMLAFFFKPYFDGFLKEAGKDHYQKVAKAVGKIWADVLGPDRRIRASVIASPPNKAEATPTYSREFSLMGEAGERKFKLLLPHEATLDATMTATERLLEFLERCHAGEVVIPEPFTMGGLTLLTWDPASGTLCYVDGRTGQLTQT